MTSTITLAFANLATENFQHNCLSMLVDVNLHMHH